MTTPERLQERAALAVADAAARYGDAVSRQDLFYRLDAVSIRLMKRSQEAIKRSRRMLAERAIRQLYEDGSAR